jgi:competence protein ComEC
VKVTAKSFSVLLTADVEAMSEADLIKRYAAHPETLKSDVLMMPHHGSLTSSSLEFIEAVAPKLAVINAGYRNRFGHPRDGVLSRYIERKISVLRTDWHGAITIDSAQGLANIAKERDTRQRYWVDRPDPEDRRPIE